MILQIDVTVTGAGGQVATGSVAVDVTIPPAAQTAQDVNAAMRDRSRIMGGGIR